MLLFLIPENGAYSKGKMVEASKKAATRDWERFDIFVPHSGGAARGKQCFLKPHETHQFEGCFLLLFYILSLAVYTYYPRYETRQEEETHNIYKPVTVKAPMCLRL